MRKLLLLPAALLLLLLARPLPAAAQSDLRYLAYNVDITLNESGGYTVEETQIILFDGEYTSGFAQIPRQYTTQIAVLGVADSEGAYAIAGDGARTYTISSESDFIYIDWQFEPTSAGETRTFVIRYEVSGGLFVYPQELRLNWELIAADRSGVPVDSTQLTLRFPRALTAEQFDLVVEGTEMETTLTENVLQLSGSTEIRSGTAVRVVVAFDPQLLPDAAYQPWQTGEDNAALVFSIDEIVAALTITGDGRVQVDESQSLSVLSGALASGYRVISLRQLDAITDVAIAEGDNDFLVAETDCVNCYRVQATQRRSDWVRYNQADQTVVYNPDSFGSVELLWEFPLLVKGDATRFRLRFTAVNAIQLLEDRQRLTWTVIPTDNPDVAAAEVRLTLPPGIALDDVQIEGGTLHILEDGTLAVRHEGPVTGGDGWQISITMPLDATTAAKSLWQQDLEKALDEARVAAEAAAEAAAATEARRARGQLVAAALSVLLGVGGLLGVVLLWYLRGRDPEALVSPPERLSEPPSGLPAGAVAYLLEETLTGRGLTASLFELAELGLVRVPLNGTGSTLFVQLNHNEPLDDLAEVADPDGVPVAVAPHLIRLFNLIQADIPAGQEKSWSGLLEKMRPHLPAFYFLMGQEASHFFAEPPEAVRTRWQRISQLLIIGGIVAALLSLIIWVGAIGWIAAGPALALVVVGLVLLAVSHALPQRTEAGVLEADLWRAYQRYLRELQATDGKVAAVVLERHFAYAVALDVVDVVVETAARDNPPPPIWTRPVLWQTLRPGQANPQTRPQPLPGEVNLPGDGLPGPLLQGRPGAEREGWSLDRISRSLSGSLNNANRSGMDILNAAVDAADEMPFELLVRGAGEVAKFTWKAGTGTAKVLIDVLESSASGGGSGGYSGGSSRSSRSSSGRSSSSRGGGFSSRSSGRSMSSGRSSGGRRGFK